MWQAISLVGSGLALVAFLVAAFYTFSARILHAKERFLQAVPKPDRLQALQSLTDSFTLSVSQLDVNHLSADQQFGLILEQMRETSRRRIMHSVLLAFIAALFAVVAIVAIRSVPTPIPELKIAQSSDSTVATPPRQLCSQDGNATIIDLGAVDTATVPGRVVAAAPYLGRCGLGVTDLLPPQSELVLINNLHPALYEGKAVRPTQSQTFLTQLNTGNTQASFTLRLPTPVRTVGFSRPVLYGYSPSGITYPAWTASALDESGNVIASHAESLLRRAQGDPAPYEIYGLTAPGIDKISMVRIEADPRRNGIPFAAFSSVLIDRIEIRP